MENFNKIYSENHKMVLNFVVRKTNDFEIAEELTNDIFMKVHKHLFNYKPEVSSMKTWIMNITNNTVIDYYRRKKLETISLSSSNNDDDKEFNFGMSVASNSNPYKEMVAAEGLEKIKKSIDDLPKKYSDIANLYFNDDLSYDEIAMRLNIPLGTVKGQINRVREKLTSKLVRV